MGIKPPVSSWAMGLVYAVAGSGAAISPWSSVGCRPAAMNAVKSAMLYRTAKPILWLAGPRFAQRQRRNVETFKQRISAASCSLTRWSGVAAGVAGVAIGGPLTVGYDGLNVRPKIGKKTSPPV